MNNKESSDIIRPGLWANGKELQAVRKRLRAKIPKITLYDIRRERTSNCEALIMDLYEGGYRNSAHFMEDLIQLEKTLLESKKLEESYLETPAGQECLISIGKYMKRAELKLMHPENKETIEELTKLALQLMEVEAQMWVVEKIFEITLKATRRYRLDGGWLEARVRFQYAMFLIEKCGAYEAAYDALHVAYKMSMSKEWTIKLGKLEERNLFNEINLLLFRCLSQRKIEKNIPLRLELSRRALKYALASENKFAIPRAYILRGDREMDAKNYTEAANFYAKGVTYAQMSNQPKYICECYLKRGYAFLRMGEVSRATTFAKLARKASVDSNSDEYLAKSHMLYGEIALSRSSMNIASYNLVLATDIFTRVENEHLAKKARFLGAYAIGHSVLEHLVTMIRKSDQDNILSSSVEKLVRWKERQIPFWDDNVDNENLRRIGDGSEHISKDIIDIKLFESYAQEGNKVEGVTGSHRLQKHLYQQLREYRKIYF